MKLPTYVLLLQTQPESAAIIYEIAKLLIVAAFSTLITYFATRKKNESEVQKILADTTETNSNREIAEQKNKAYWMDRFEKGLEEAIILEEENADLRIFKRHAMRLLKKIQRAFEFEKEETLMNELDELILEGEA